jgi:hypothetical protein
MSKTNEEYPISEKIQQKINEFNDLIRRIENIIQTPVSDPSNVSEMVVWKSDATNLIEKMKGSWGSFSITYPKLLYKHKVLQETSDNLQQEWDLAKTNIQQQEKELEEKNLKLDHCLDEHQGLSNQLKTIIAETGFVQDITSEIKQISTEDEYSLYIDNLLLDLQNAESMLCNEKNMWLLRLVQLKSFVETDFKRIFSIKADDIPQFVQRIEKVSKAITHFVQHSHHKDFVFEWEILKLLGFVRNVNKIVTLNSVSEVKG